MNNKVLVNTGSINSKVQITSNRINYNKIHRRTKKPQQNELKRGPKVRPKNCNGRQQYS